MKIEKTHQMKLTEVVGPRTLKALITDHIIDSCGDHAFIEAFRKGGNVKIRIERETEGSPSYPVDRWKAFVEIIVDLDDEQ